jgi:hypothetical protein
MLMLFSFKNKLGAKNYDRKVKNEVVKINGPSYRAKNLKNNQEKMEVK